MRRIRISTGKMAVVDDCDFATLSQHRWSWSNGYAVRCSWVRGTGRGRMILMHREILGLNRGGQVDHKNGNRLDNRRGNLRICGNSEQRWNSRKPKNNTSGYKGVHLHKDSGMWRAQVAVNGRRVQVGYFRTARSAKIARNKAAKKLHGKFFKT